MNILIHCYLVTDVDFLEPSGNLSNDSIYRYIKIYAGLVCVSCFNLVLNLINLIKYKMVLFLLCKICRKLKPRNRVVDLTFLKLITHMPIGLYDEERYSSDMLR